MPLLLRTNSSNPHFISLVKELDAYLVVQDGDQHDFYNQYNKLDEIKFVIIAYENKIPVGCAAIKEYEIGVMEIKRMYTMPQYRGKGIASRVLIELEIWAKELHYKKCILETGKKQNDAIALYKKNGYKLIPNYGQYAQVKSSFCFEKKLQTIL